MENNREKERKIKSYLDSLSHQQRESIVMNSAVTVGKNLGKLSK